MKSLLKATLLAGAGTLAITGAAASDLSGAYVGLNGGYGWGKIGTLTYDGSDPAGGCADRGGGNTFCGPDKFPGLSTSGGFGGAQVGYNWFANSGLMLGIETDFQGGSVGGKATDTHSLDPAYNRPIAYEKTNIDWFGTVRARLGLAYGSMLVYATGGFAYGNQSTDIFLNPNPAGSSCTSAVWSGCVSLKDSHIGTGYTIGGGAEWAFSPSWSAKVEYQYIDLGNISTKGINSLDLQPRWTEGVDDAFQTVRVGINYHLGQTGYSPLK